MAIRQLFLRDFPFILAGNILSSLAQWLLLLYLSRASGVDAMGVYIWVLSLLTPITTFATLGLRNLIAANAHPEISFSHYFHIRLGATLIALAIALGCALYSEHRQQRDFFLLIGLLKAIEMQSDLCYGYLHLQAKAWYQGISLMLRFGLGIPAFALGSLLTASYYGGFGALILVWLGTLLLLDRRAIAQGVLTDPPHNHAVSVGQLIKLLHRSALPLALASTLGAVIFNLPRYVIGAVHGDYILGIFAALTSFIMLQNLLCIALGQTLLPRLSALHLANNLPGFLRLLLIAMVITVVISLMLVAAISVFGTEILTLTFGPELAEYNAEFLRITLLAIPLLMGQVISYANMAVKQFSNTLWVSIASGLASLLMAWPVINHFGILGGGLIMAVVGCTQIIGFMFSILSQFRTDTPESTTPTTLPQRH